MLSGSGGNDELVPNDYFKGGLASQPFINFLL
jgi:hypothetical protein